VVGLDQHDARQPHRQADVVNDAREQQERLGHRVDGRDDVAGAGRVEQQLGPAQPRVPPGERGADHARHGGDPRAHARRARLA
jgi:hypothetical protein